MRRDRRTPKTIFNGGYKDFNAEGVMKNFTLMRGSDGEFSTTDLIEALDKGIETFKGDAGVIWLVTDNINDNSGSGDSSYFNTLSFYQRLRNDNNIKKILLYPIPEKVTKVGYTSLGYVVWQ